MLKKILMLTGIMFMCCFMWIANNKPIFNDYSDTFEVYNGNSSHGFSVVNKYKYLLIGNKNGESFRTNKAEFDTGEFLGRFNAKIVITEKIGEGLSVYAFSKDIKYCETVGGKRVNIQIFIPCDEREIVVGSPIIYGSF